MSAAVSIPLRAELRLDELVLAARLSGVPLPLQLDEEDRPDRPDRLSGRLTRGRTRTASAAALLAAALARVEESGPEGARASLEQRGLVEGETLDEGLSAALTVLAAAPLGALLDLSVIRAEGELRLRSWWGVSSALAAQLSTGDGLDYELAWFTPELWVTQVERAITVDPWCPHPAPLALPDYVSLPSELLLGSEKAHRERRADLVPDLARFFAVRVRMGEPGDVRSARPDEVVALLTTLGTATRGRLRLVAHRRRGGHGDPAVAAWLLLDDGWHELRPGRDATAVLRRRHPRDLGLFTWSAVRALTEDAA